MDQLTDGSTADAFDFLKQLLQRNTHTITVKSTKRLLLIDFSIKESLLLSNLFLLFHQAVIMYEKRGHYLFFFVIS